MRRLRVLFISLAVATVATYTSAATANHKIKKGDSLYAIAKANKTTVAKLCKLNGISKNDTLKLGKVLKVPSAKKVVTTQKYKVKSGDALYTLAKKHKTDVATLKSMNGLKGNILKAGQTIKVPASKSVKVAKKTTTKVIKSDKKLAQTLSKLPTKTYAKKESSKNNILNFNFKSLFAEEKPTKKIIDIAKTKLGNRYVWGATGKKNTFDCSGFTKYVYKKNGIEIPRTSIRQSKHGEFVPRENLKKGDLVFFDTSKRRKGYVNHVGIYLGDDKFIHASSAKKKVVITSLNKPFYSQRYMGARRPS